MLGVDAEHLPQNYDECETMFGDFKRRWQGDTEAGRLLTKALLDFVKSELPFFLRGVPPALARRLVGDETAKLLGIKKPNPIRWVVNGAALLALKWINRKRRRLYEAMPQIQIDSEWLSRRLLVRISRLKPEWRDDLLHIPTHLASRWDLSEAGGE